MAVNIEKRREVKEVIDELKKFNIEAEKLIEQLPTTDDKILAKLNLLFNSLPVLLNTKTTIEKGSLLYEQAVGKAISLRERYNYRLTNGTLRKVVRQ